MKRGHIFITMAIFVISPIAAKAMGGYYDMMGTTTEAQNAADTQTATDQMLVNHHWASTSDVVCSDVTNDEFDRIGRDTLHGTSSTSPSNTNSKYINYTNGTYVETGRLMLSCGSQVTSKYSDNRVSYPSNRDSDNDGDMMDSMMGFDNYSHLSDSSTPSISVLSILFWSILVCLGISIFFALPIIILIILVILKKKKSK